MPKQDFVRKFVFLSRFSTNICPDRSTKLILIFGIKNPQHNEMNCGCASALFPCGYVNLNVGLLASATWLPKFECGSAGDVLGGIPGKQAAAGHMNQHRTPMSHHCLEVESNRSSEQGAPARGR